ncbi:skin secretory protein xP2-like [Galleria mellonella]|uniref:Skin secretory protein xP2-like n=1 Tax=Galleria mellonella TaxID=7137 RepID=A0ABM3N3P4_GALME|nr:skin secretory protein xP2-like [Galleria mellonella]
MCGDLCHGSSPAGGVPETRDRGRAPHRYGFKINEKVPVTVTLVKRGRGEARRGAGVTRGPGRAACLHAGAGGRRQAAGAAGGDRCWAGRAPRAAPGASPPRGRVRAVVACRCRCPLRRAGVSPRPRAPGGGGEPRAARPRAHAAPARRSPARSRSAPAPAPAPAAARRRARSLAARAGAPAAAAPAPAPAPRLRPVFLWARQHDGTVQEVHCEDYDPRNRIRIARTPNGWRVIPRTEIYNSIRVPAPPPRERKERRRRGRSGRSRRRRVDRPDRGAEQCAEPATVQPAWLAPDLESHIPSHTIAVPRVVQQPPPPAEPTPLDNLLAVAELEFNQQRGEELELEGSGA